MKTIFLSHNHLDKDFVRRLGVDLTRSGARVWIDEAEILLGDSILSKVQSGLSAADYVAVILSPNSVKSSWVQLELETALDDELKNGHVKVLPLLLADCQLPLFLKGRLYADFRNEDLYESGLALIERRLGLNPDLTQKQLTERTISKDEATEIIAVFSQRCGLKIRRVTEGTRSPASNATPAFKARLTDGKGVVYCHAGGALAGKAFYVRKGIGWFYEYKLGGSDSELGLPTSNEEWTDSKSDPSTLFEGGYIQWNQKTSVATAIRTSGGKSTVIGDRRL